MQIIREREIDLLLAGRAGIDLNTTCAGCTFSEIPSFTKSVRRPISCRGRLGWA